MAKREYVEANKRWLEEKAREEGVQALPRGIYYKVLKAGNPDGANPAEEASLRHTIRDGPSTARSLIPAVVELL